MPEDGGRPHFGLLSRNRAVWKLHHGSSVRCYIPGIVNSSVGFNHRNVVPGEEVPSIYRPVFVSLALTGLRAGELLALQWNNVCLETGGLRVEQSLWNK